MADQLFHTIYGRGLIGELPKIAHRPYYVVTMEDLWFLSEQVWNEHLAGVHFVESLEYEDLESMVDRPCVALSPLRGRKAVGEPS